jgi:hypothetical protein
MLMIIYFTLKLYDYSRMRETTFLCPFACTYVMLRVDLSAVRKGFEAGYNIRQLYPQVVSPRWCSG